jgi:hypothetical protein
VAFVALEWHDGVRLRLVHGQARVTVEVLSQVLGGYDRFLLL